MAWSNASRSFRRRPPASLAIHSPRGVCVDFRLYASFVPITSDRSTWSRRPGRGAPPPCCIAGAWRGWVLRYPSLSHIGGGEASKYIPKYLCRYEVGMEVSTKYPTTYLPARVGFLDPTPLTASRACLHVSSGWQGATGHGHQWSGLSSSSASRPPSAKGSIHDCHLSQEVTMARGAFLSF